MLIALLVLTRPTTPTPAATVLHGKPYKGRYPYWVPTKDSPLYYQDPDQDEDEFFTLIGFED